MKDPFVELVKGSLNTFLNAMTYPDKTVYPVASCNDKDFQNLMDVYMDGVLHPRIYREPKIFLQEGWHYELESPEDDLTINGVVYNEMKGAFSSPESVLDRYTRTVLFPDNSYANESGGDPAFIPELTYEQFIRFPPERITIRPTAISTSTATWIWRKSCEWLDEQYLSRYDRKDCQVDSSIPLQEPFDGTGAAGDHLLRHAGGGNGGQDLPVRQHGGGHGPGSQALCGFPDSGIRSDLTPRARPSSRR